MSKYSAGDYFGALIYRTFEECQEPDFYQLQKKLARNLYLSLAYAPAFWLSKLRQEVGINDQSSQLLSSYIDKKLSGFLPTWLPRGQIKDLIDHSISVVQSHWNHRKQLAEIIEKKTNCTLNDLSLSQKSTLPAIAPYLYQASVLQYQQRIKQINVPSYPIAICPQINQYRPYAIQSHSQWHWEILANKDGKHYCLEWQYVQPHFKPISINSPHFIEYEEKGFIDQWSWGAREILLNLDQMIQVAAPLPIEAVVVIALDILRGLSTIHEAGYIHGALMPQNLLINEACGLLFSQKSSWYECAQELVPEKLPLSYWSPEQLSQQAITSKQSDMWCFGLILYQLLCGALPWASLSDPMALSRAILNFDIKSRANVPDGMRLILQKCLSQESQRFENAKQALDILEESAFELSPLIKAQKLQSSWQQILDEHKMVQLIQSTPIKEEEVTQDTLMDLFKNHFHDIDPSTIIPLFPDIYHLYRRYWNNDNHREQFKKSFEDALENFRLKLSQVSPDFLFEQLSILSRQKETLEKRFQAQLAECQSKEDMILKEIQTVAWQSLKKSWIQLRLPSELMPAYQEKSPLKTFKDHQIDLKNYSLSPKSIPSQNTTQKPLAINKPTPIVASVTNQQIKVNYQYDQGQTQANPQEIALDRLDFSAQRQKFNHHSISLAPPEAIAEELSENQVIEEQEADHSFDASFDPKNISAEHIQAAQHAADQAEAMLKEELKTIPPAQRFERLEEFQSKKEQINLTRPSQAVAPVSDADFEDDLFKTTPDFLSQAHTLDASVLSELLEENDSFSQQYSQAPAQIAPPAYPSNPKPNPSAYQISIPPKYAVPPAIHQAYQANIGQNKTQAYSAVAKNQPIVHQASVELSHPQFNFNTFESDPSMMDSWENMEGKTDKNTPGASLIPPPLQVPSLNSNQKIEAVKTIVDQQLEQEMDPMLQDWMSDLDLEWEESNEISHKKNKK